MDRPKNTPRLESIDQVSDGWVKKYVLAYRQPDGSLHDYEVASRKGPEDFRAQLEARGAGRPANAADAVCIAAVTPDDAVVMIREFRYPLNSWCIALPAGLVDEGESPQECAARELLEETGYAVVPDRPLRLLPQAGFSSTGLTDEAVQVVFATAQRQGAPRPERHELIEVFELPLADIPHFLEENTLPIGTRAQLILAALAARRQGRQDD